MLIDTHTHLDDEKFSGQLDNIIKSALSNDVEKIITIGSDVDSTKEAIEITKKYAMVFATAGCHPHEADIYTVVDAKQELLSLAKHKKIVAIGETGLDFYKDYSERKNQLKLFEMHIEIAKKSNLPLIIHCRNAYKQVLDVIKVNQPLNALIHCFSGNKQDAKKCIDIGLYISVAGPLTFPEARNLRDTIKTIPVEFIMLETDCPYISPHPYRGQRNEPANVRLVAEALAKLFGIDFDKIADITTRNALKFFRLAS
jgi:TatD DNase family protein